jgi:hypothetical protein
MNLAEQSLAITSVKAAQLWQELEQTTTEDEVEQLLQSLWETQENQEIATDICADLVDQIEAEAAAFEERLDYLTKIHQDAIDKLGRWRERLDQTVLRLNESGLVNAEVVGKRRRIQIKENPPTCEINVKPAQLPEEYRYEKVKTTIVANKKAITAAWKKGIPIDGTHVYRKRRVEYQMLSGSNLQAFQASKKASV